MNTEKIEKLKKGLTNSQIPESLREKIRQQISRLEAEDKANEPVTKAEIQKIEDKIEDAVEVAEKKEATAKVAKARSARTPRAKRTVAPKARTARKPRAKKVVEPKTTTGSKNTAMSLAKEIRKEGEKWSDAVKRAGTQMKKGNTEIKKSTNTELKKLLALVKTRKELKGITGTNLKRDSKRKAKPLGKRVSEDGNVYYEYRDNRTDRLAPNYPKNAPLLAGGGSVDKVKIRDWYMKTYPTDELGEELNPNVTFEDLWNEDYKKYDIYQVMGVGDSLIRERLFEHLAEIKGVGYDVVYRKLFSSDGFYDDGGGVDYYEQLTVYVTGVGTLGSGTSMRKAIDKAREYEKKNPNAEVVIVDEKYGDEYDSDGNFKNEYATGGGVDNLPTNLKTRLKNLKGRVTISKAQALKAYELHSERGMGGSTIGYEMFDAKNKRDSETFGDLAIDLGRHYSKFAGGGGIRSQSEINKIISEKEKMVKNLTPKEISEMWNKNSYGVNKGISKPMTIEEAKNPNMRFYLKNLLIENELSEKEYDKYFADGGGVDGIEEDIDMTDDYVLRVNKGVEPENRASMKDWMGKTNESREAMAYELGGATMQYDLAGNTSGGTGGLNADMPLSGVSSTKYTDLVGETGALSSGEMFARGGGVRKVGNREYPLGRNWTNDHNQVNKSEEHETSYNRKGFFATGGAVMANQQIIADASQQYVNYYLGEGASAGMFKDGGAIKNQYKGRSPMDVWDNLSNEQRLHFLKDHKEEILEHKKLRYFTVSDLNELINSDWIGLDDDVRNEFAEHTIWGQYAYGGKMHDYKEREDDYARGGGIRTINGREYSTGRNWTNDHTHHNKMQDYEVPMSKRR